MFVAIVHQSFMYEFVITHAKQALIARKFLNLIV